MSTRLLIASAAVAVLVGVVATAVALGPEDIRKWLLLSGLVAGVAAVQGVGSDPADLAPALVFSLPPVLALLVDGSPTWLIGPLGALLLLSAELGALSWDCQREAPLNTIRRRRLRRVAVLAALGLGAALVVPAVALAPLSGGTAALVIAALAFAAVGPVLFRRGA